MHDLAIEGGTVVTGRGRERRHVYVTDGRIAEVTLARRDARERVDAGGLLVMPGMVDAHVHFMDPGAADREDFPAGSAAAVRAGVTTVIEHTHAGPVRDVAELREKLRHLERRSRVDFALGAHAWPGRTGEVAPLRDAGVAFLKAFTCTTHGVPGHDPAHLHALFEAAAAADATCLVHCEDESMTAGAERLLRPAGREDGGVVAAWRSPDAELVAVTVCALLARRTGARAVVAHASGPDVVAAAWREREAGARLLVETCPQYLTLLESEAVEQGALRKFTPPARARSRDDLARMWREVTSGRVDYVASDHAPATLAQKRAGSIWDVHFGLPGVDTTLSVLLDATWRGLLTHERVVELYSEAPARIYGLAGKGSLEPGADADLVLVDPAARWTVRAGDILSRAGWSPYEGRELRGRAVRTYLRGVLAADAGRVVAEPGLGRWLSAGADARRTAPG